MGRHLAVDIGGTFTDFVLADTADGSVRIEKMPSRYEELDTYFFEGIERLGTTPAELDGLLHGTTIALNTIIQERGCKVGLLTTAGFRDALEICRGGRTEIYNLLFKHPVPIVPRRLRREVPERLDHRGEVVTPIDLEAAEREVRFLLDEGCEAIAVTFLHAYRSPQHELAVGELIERIAPGTLVSLSHRVSPEWREFERTSTTALNSYVAPNVARYLDTLEQGLGARSFPGSLSIMQSTGGSTSAERGRDAPISTLESGPAGGVIAAARVATDLGRTRAISADVGGTSFDVSLIVDGEPAVKSQTEIERRPVLLPSIDIVSIGAGGGSIARVDPSGALHIGPESAQATPGPACFGRGGTRPTVTDAYATLGIIDPENFLGKRMQLDLDAAADALRREVAEPLGLSSAREAAGAVVRLTTMNMVLAIRNITIERGHDPREFTLIGFGGGGGMFSSYVAHELELPEFVVPALPANFSAWGILNSDYRHDGVRHLLGRVDDALLAQARDALAELTEEGRAAVLRWGHGADDPIAVQWFLDLRYVGQEHTIRVAVEPDAALEAGAVRERFEQLHLQTYSHVYEGQPIELVNARAVVIGQRERSRPPAAPAAERPDAAAALIGTRAVSLAGEEPSDVPIYDRERLQAGATLEGPAIVQEWTSTTVISPGDRLTVHPEGHLVVACGR